MKQFNFFARPSVHVTPSIFLLVCSLHFLGNEVGDLCNKDFDGDGFPDNSDSCPHIDNIHKTSFQDHFIVWLDGKNTSNDVWKISNEVNVSCLKNSCKKQGKNSLLGLLL